MFIVAAMTAMLIDSIVLVMDDAFADKKRHDDKKKGGYEKGQTVSQVNDCGNGFMSENVGCQNTASQIQGDDNSVGLASEQEFEEESNNAVPPI